MLAIWYAVMGDNYDQLKPLQKLPVAIHLLLVLSHSVAYENNLARNANQFLLAGNQFLLGLSHWLLAALHSGLVDRTLYVQNVLHLWLFASHWLSVDSHLLQNVSHLWLFASNLLFAHKLARVAGQELQLANHLLLAYKLWHWLHGE